MRRILSACVIALALAAVALGEDGPVPCGDKSARQSQKWVRDAVIYEVFTRSFSEEGSFREVERALPRLREAGVTVVWLMPIHRIGALNRKGHIGSPYSVQDFYSIDPMYGTADDLKSLTRAAHGMGMRVIIDMVANHTSWDSAMMKLNPDFYTRKDGKIVAPVPDWTDVADLNYDCAPLRGYMTDMLKFWVREFDIDGFRCDVANMIPLDFWEKARAELETVKPDILMLAEGDWPQSHVKAFDLTYSWRFYEAMIDVAVRGMPATRLREVYEKEAAMFPKGSLIMRFNDNHDKIRAVTLFGDDAALLTAGVALTVRGVPMLYNGQEIGDPVPSNDPALFEKYDILWDNHPPRMRRFQSLYREILQVRAGSAAIREGEMAFVATDKPDAVSAFKRTAGSESVLVFANFTNRPTPVKLVESGLSLDGYAALYPKNLAPPAKDAPISLPPFGLAVFGKK